MSGEFAPDGSPVAVYLALPSGSTPDLIDSAIPPRSTILELGSGPGRISRPLIELGHRVTAVDDSAEMLAHNRTAEPILGDLFTLSLDRTFDVVVAGSHLINDPDPERRGALLEVCRRHVAGAGVVLIERYPPSWVADPKPSSGQVGPIGISFQPLETAPGWLKGRVVYTLGNQQWAQEFTASEVTDDMLVAEARSAGLVVGGWLDEPPTWARLTVA